MQPRRLQSAKSSSSSGCNQRRQYAPLVQAGRAWGARLGARFRVHMWQVWRRRQLRQWDRMGSGPSPPLSPPLPPSSPPSPPPALAACEGRARIHLAAEQPARPSSDWSGAAVGFRKWPCNPGGCSLRKAAAPAAVTSGGNMRRSCKRAGRGEHDSGCGSVCTCGKFGCGSNCGNGTEWDRGHLIRCPHP